MKPKTVYLIPFHFRCSEYVHTVAPLAAALTRQNKRVNSIIVFLLFYALIQFFVLGLSKIHTSHSHLPNIRLFLIYCYGVIYQ